MKVAIVSFECVPFAKVGGLADVVGTLPLYLKKQKVDVRIIIPFHKKVNREKFLNIPPLKDTKKKILVPISNNFESGG
ncbi:MAG: glycogen/starch synthase, partial [Elusimicrobiota bacterium]|nr:glycogen/starch synthase [Elusimicrobiota bacterium]